MNCATALPRSSRLRITFLLARTRCECYKERSSKRIVAMAFLYHIRANDGTPTEFWPVGEKPLVVGRGDSVDAFVDDDSLSRSHFLVVREAGEYFVIDL